MSRYLLFLLAFQVQSAELGWAYCTHSRLDEKLISVRVAFMIGEEEYSYRTLTGTNIKSQVLTFKPATAPVALDGMKIDCKFMDGTPRPSRITVHRPWPQAITISAGVSPKLGVAVEETSPGLWRAYIGKAP